MQIPFVLIHLVSGQTMQNLLPLIALRPRVIIQVRSRGEAFATAASSLARAAEVVWAAGNPQEPAQRFEEVVIEEDSPGLEAVKTTIGNLLNRHPEALVNVTGGTKPMSIGAWRAAEARGNPILYCETSECRWVSVGRAPLPELPSFEEVAGKLTVAVIMAAHGVNVPGWKASETGPRYLDFGEEAWNLHAHHGSHLLEFARSLRESFKPDGHPLNRERFRVRNRHPITERPSAAVEAYLRAAERLGVVRETDGGFYFRDEMTRKEQGRAVDLLEGLWLELAVLGRMRKNPRYGDVQWSVKPASQDDSAFGETDIVAVDRKRIGLTLVSCKAAAPGLEHVEAVRRRQETLGGRYARSVLCVFHAGDQESERLREWSWTLGVECLIGSDIQETLGLERSPGTSAGSSLSG